MPAAAATPTVALVGTLQSELGCPGDWQPDCPATELLPVDGQPGLYRATFVVPQGTYAYKVALDDSWDVNYGAGGAPGGGDIPLSAPGGPVTFTYDDSTHRVTDDAPVAVGSESAAQWLRKGTVALDLPDDRAGWTYRLWSAPEGGLTRDGDEITGGTSTPLELRGELSAGLRRAYPHLAAYESLRVPAAVQRRLPALLTGQLAVAAYDASGALQLVTGVQLPGVLDDVYPGARERTLGPTWKGSTPRVSVWAPTAKTVALRLQAGGEDGERTVAMRRDDDGVWSVKGKKSWRDARYRFEVEVYAPTTQKIETNLVTDPYSLGLTTDSERSVLVDLRSREVTPSGWKNLRKPAFRRDETPTVYELHVRDFSISDETVPAAHRGTYLAFTDRRSDGMTHLRQLADAGMGYVHLLPVNDIASIEEDRAKQQTPDCDLASYGPASEEQQACVTAVAGKDGFNWGYDPLHYTAPEGSYSTDPDGTARNREFRQMVAGLNGAGQRVVMDVVYNHTPASGQDPKSILDRVVPGYYQRLSATGAVENSTCCANTATEHPMMEKLMIDSVVTWAKEYKVDGFRFDLMGHQPKQAMLDLRRALDRLTVKRDGVDGKRVILYGEGWNFGEVADNARFVQATQAEMAGTGIGTFNDRLRDAVRGGGPFDEDPRVQGFASGLYTDPNGDTVNGSEADQLAALLLAQDRIKVGLAGNLKGYRFVDRTGARVRGDQVDYNGQPTGYTDRPGESVNYVEAHDNETLFDALTYKLPVATSMDDRIRMQSLALATTALSQGTSFWTAGGDQLRSKSFDRNSYDSGDWFNVLDWSKTDNGFGRGLPPKADNEAKWDAMRPLLAEADLKPGRSDIAEASRQADALLEIRRSTPLFALRTRAQVQQKVSFGAGGPDQTPGVITMRIDDTRGARVDRRWKGVVVVFNASPETTTQPVAGAAGKRFALHPVQAGGSDAVVRTAAYDRADGTFTVPGRTVAVFVQR
ncbi:alpha-1,6-glucosidases, pullulanase-type [Microlunatus sagamiharensis]|uniref:Alpha-1,6-glucosidases, pullulanase-type n=1 Tax=Microlunatus sagamiharensis TaxID=546874 RepID=A0A1H2NDP3_9ACTN|nr:alpha-1,6-glucosidases, pullulanase-type [Microlunatus sagamiharensis]